MTKKQLNILPLLLAVLLLVSGCSKGTEPGTTQSTGLLPTAIAAETPDPNKKTTGIGFYFDTVVSLSLWGAPEGLMDEIWAACARYEQLLSKTIDASDVSRINNAMGQTVTVDPETWEILRRAKEISAQTGGAFSITIAPVTALWSFTDTVTNMVPTDEARLKMLPLVDDQKIALGENNTVTLPAGMEIDLGGIAKGYIADKVADIIREKAYAGIVSLDPKQVDMSDGQLEVLLVRAPQNLTEITECIQAVQNQVYNCSMITFCRCSTMTVYADPDMPWTLDGEREDGHTKIRIENAHLALRVIRGKLI